MRTLTYRFLLIFLTLFLMACNEKPTMDELRPQDEDAIIRNLPAKDREYLLLPLESALDDLREIAENDPGLRDTTITIDEAERKGTALFRINDSDTMMMRTEIETPSSRETHEQFWDKKGNLFLLEAKITRLAPDGKSVEKRAYRIYFEEGPQRLSAYGKVAYGEDRLPQNWVTICPTAEEESYLLNRR